MCMFNNGELIRGARWNFWKNKGQQNTSEDGEREEVVVATDVIRLRDGRMQNFSDSGSFHCRGRRKSYKRRVTNRLVSLVFQISKHNHQKYFNVSKQIKIYNQT